VERFTCAVSRREFDEIERIKEKYDLSYNEIICSAVKIYVGLTLAKEIIASALEDKDIQSKGKNLGKILNSQDYQANMDQKIAKIAKVLIWEFFEKGMVFSLKSISLRKERKVGRPKEGLD